MADGATTARSANRIEYVATQAPDSAAQDRLLLLDGHSLAYRAFFALPIENFSTTTGQPTNAVYGFTAMLINVLRDEKPTHVAVAFDRGEPTFRHEQWVEYKANRRETPEDFRSQLSLIFEVLDALGIRRLSAPGYEADDLIATLATQAAAEKMDVLIVTGDRDVLQLVSDRVTVLMTRRGITEMTRFTPETVQEKYGLSPAQYPDFAAVRGDPSDNLPGIPGVGEKTATKWIAEFGSLANLVDRVDEVKGKVGDALREHLATVLRNRQLTSLLTETQTALFVHVDGLSANPSFVDFHFATITAEFSLRPIAPLVLHHQPDAVKHEPCRLLSHADGLGDLVAADAVLAVADHPNDQQPLLKRDGRVLENGSYLGRELTVFMGALALPLPLILKERHVVPSASWTGNDTIRPTLNSHILQAVIEVREVQDGFLQSLWGFHV